MAIYAKKITAEQYKWLLDYERSTTFEPLHQEEIDSGAMTFKEAAKDNVRWFEDWSHEVLSDITTNIPE